MNYPFWEVPFHRQRWVIGIIAIFHVMISQFAVGGGLCLPMAERKALREGREDWMIRLQASLAILSDPHRRLRHG